ncbi:universal stress protein [Actinoplanes sp. NPDC023714]|uniref:universal stress protein n=1 Tax=Actinoplanes sp. NPDC023714 TaxID=3154322 RepID=UPI0033CFC6A7
MYSVVSVEEKLPVVVGVDGVPAGLDIVDVAAAEAAHRQVPLTVVHAWPGRHGESQRHRMMRPDPDDGHHLLDLAARRIRTQHPDLPLHTELADENAAEALLRQSMQACLLVIRHRDEVALGHGWGSTAAYLAHHSACPLLVCRGPAIQRGPVVLAASGRRSPTAGCAFEAAARTGSPLVATHVCASDADRRATNRSLTSSLSGWQALWPDVAVQHLLITEADIAYTAERASRRARLLVGGRGDKGWFVETLYVLGGAVSGTHRQCPVLLVPPGWPQSASPATLQRRRRQQ